MIEYRTWKPSRFGPARPRYFTTESEARAFASRVFDATRIVVAVEPVKARRTAKGVA